MTWDAHHRRSDVLRAVVDEANLRRDGALPMELPGVAETFRDEFDLLATLQLRWHTRLAGTTERALADEPADLEKAVLTAWRETAAELVGVRRILDAYAEHPSTPAMGKALERARAKDWMLMAAMAGRASAQDARGARVGQRLEEEARAGFDPASVARPERPARHAADQQPTLLRRLKARLAA